MLQVSEHARNAAGDSKSTTTIATQESLLTILLNIPYVGGLLSTDTL